MFASRSQYTLYLLSASIKQKRCSSSLAEATRQVKNELFIKEQKRQQQLVPRVEKIEVQYKGTPKDCTLIMNKGISTPFNCCQHMSEMLMDRTVLAEVNGQLWDMHRPLLHDCQLSLLHFHEENPYQVNKAFWRSCSFLLGSVIETAFKDDCLAKLHSFPAPHVRSGSFVYDAKILVKDWIPTQLELRMLSGQMVRLARQNLKFERLEVDSELALKMFEGNEYKTAAIPQIAANSASGNSVTLYKVGDFVDISRGPMVGNTNVLGRCSITAVHQIDGSDGTLYRFQGVALPRFVTLNHFAYSVIEARGKKFNSAKVPGSDLRVEGLVT